MYLVAVLLSFPLQLYPVSEALEEIVLGSSFRTVFLSTIQRKLGNRERSVGEETSPQDETEETANGDEDDQLRLLGSNTLTDTLEYVFGCIWRVGLVALLAGLGLGLKDSLDHIVALLGSLASAPLALIIPPLMNLSMLDTIAKNGRASSVQEEEIAGMRYGDNGGMQPRRTEYRWQQRWLNYVLIVFGVLITVGTTGLTLATWSSGASR